MLYVEWDEATHRKAWEDYGMEKGRVEGGSEILALLKQGMSVEEAEKTFYEKHSLQGSKT